MYDLHFPREWGTLYYTGLPGGHQAWSTGEGRPGQSFFGGFYRKGESRAEPTVKNQWAWLLLAGSWLAMIQSRANYWLGA